MMSRRPSRPAALFFALVGLLIVGQLCVGTEGHSHAHTAGGHDHSHDHGDPSHGHSHAHAGGGHDHGHDHAGESECDGNHDVAHGGHSHDHSGHAPPAHSHSHAEQDDHHHDDHSHHAGRFDPDVFGRDRLWMMALTSSFAVSCASLVCLALLPVLAALRGKRLTAAPPKALIKLLTGFAVGAMLGDAFLHQLPHAFADQGGHGGHSHSHSHGGHGHDHSLTMETLWQGVVDQAVGLSVLAGLLAFFLVEVLVRSVEGATGHGHSHGHSHASTSSAGSHSHGSHSQSDGCCIDGGHSVEGATGHGHSHGHSHGSHSQSDGVGFAGEVVKASGSSVHDASGLSRRGGIPPGAARVTATVGATEGGFAGGASAKEAPRVHTAGWLNLFADAVHNFTDGMAIGAAYISGGPISGWSKTLFMLAHELPQEVGDYGILLNSGFGVLQALAFNFLSALVALAGTALALHLGGSEGLSGPLVEGFTAGGFIYIAVAGVIPEMHADSSQSTFTQVMSMTAGAAVCVLIHATGGCSG